MEPPEKEALVAVTSLEYEDFAIFTLEEMNPEYLDKREQVLLSIEIPVRGWTQVSKNLLLKAFQNPKVVPPRVK